MEYPSLLYKNEPDKPEINISVFEDLQLLHFISRDIAEAILAPCGKENILARQQFFMSLDSPKQQKQFGMLSDLIGRVAYFDRLYGEARCDNEKYIVYSALMKAVYDFSECAARTERSCELPARFASYFSDRLSDKSSVDLKEKLYELLPLLKDFESNTFRIHSSDLKMSKGVEKSYFRRICECSHDLGLDGIVAGSPAPRQLSPAVINSYAKLYPVQFGKAGEFYNRYKDAYDSSVIAYKQQIGFYLTMLGFFDRIRKAGIPLVFPNVNDGHKIQIKNAYDVSLLAKDEKNIIPNDISFTEDEPFYYLTGANGGGKTTYLRAVGISVFLYINGCPLPCDSAEMGCVSGIFTHFPRDERFDGTGRFIEEEGRVKKILSSMDDNSVVLLNETYSSTTEENAVVYTEKLAGLLYSRGIFGLYITHQHSLSESAIPYLNVLIDYGNSNRRTFKIAKQKSVHGSFAKDILEKYALTKEALEARFGGVK